MVNPIAQVIEACIPDAHQRRSVLSLLVTSADRAGAIAPSAWAVTLFSDGFRLNVGQVEAVTLAGDILRIMLAAAAGDERLSGVPLEQTDYRSIPHPQCAYVGPVDQLEVHWQRIEPAHKRFIELAATTRSGQPRKGSPHVRTHSEALLRYAADICGQPTPRREVASAPHPFVVGQTYTRNDVFRVIGVPEGSAGPWATGYAAHGPDWFIFCGIGTAGRTGHDYGNRFVGEQLDWAAKGPSKVSQPSIQDLLSPAGRVYLFYREHDRDPFTFGGIASPAQVKDTSPVRVLWDLHDPSGVPDLPSGAGELDSIETATVLEGAKKTVEVNIYERDPAARRRCIAHWGTTCVVCRFDFAATYGELGRGFVHVHHLKPLAEIGQAYVLDPVADLRPVCPNCHAMLHRRRPALTIEELAEHLASTG